MSLDVLHDRCCGLDLHKRSVTACRIVPGADGHPAQEVRTFGTMTAELLALGDWLADGGVTHIAMESTGVYWKPVWNLFEDHFELLLVNAAHVKVVPGRKRDVGDAAWLAELLRHGLLAPSFVPDRPARELRELTRYRSSLVRDRTAEVNRLQKTLEGATSIWPAWSATSRACRRERCWASWSPGLRMPRPWPRWRSGNCAASEPSWNTP